MWVLGRGVAVLSRWATILGGIAIVLMMLHVSADVIARYVFNTSLPGTLTMVTYYYMIFATFLPLALAEKRRSHISVEVLTEMLPTRARLHLQGWIMLLTAVVMGLLAWRSFDAAIKAAKLGVTQVQGNVNIPVWPAYFVLPVGASLMAAILLLRVLSNLTGLHDGLDDTQDDGALP